jgi:hypothetical protein
MSNGDRDPIAWLELLPIHLNDEASWWYDVQSGEVKASWDLLTKGLLAKFQEKESYQLLMGELNVIRQKDGEKLREYSTRIKELKERIVRSQRRTAEADGVAELDQAELDVTLASIDSTVLKNFIQGLATLLWDIVSWKQPQSFEAAFALAHKNETILADLSQPGPWS